MHVERPLMYRNGHWQGLTRFSIQSFLTWSMEIIGWPDELDSSMKQILKETTGHDELKPFELGGSQVISLLKKLVNQEGLLGRL